MSEPMTVREYAAKEGVTLGTVYRRIWEGQVNATQVYGRWLITPADRQTDKATSKPKFMDVGV